MHFLTNGGARLKTILSNYNGRSRATYAIMCVHACFLTLLLVSCDTHNHDSKSMITFYDHGRPNHINIKFSYEGQIYALDNSNPRDDLLRSVKSGDKRFVAVQSIALVCPGIPRNDFTVGLRKKYGMKIIAGTTDLLEDELATKLSRKASQYASEYNTLLLQHLSVNE